MTDTEIKRTIAGYSKSEGGFNIPQIRKVLREKYQVDEDILNKVTERKELNYLLMQHYYKDFDTEIKAVDVSTETVHHFGGPKDKKYGQLSNMHIANFTYNNTTYSTVEAAFQSAKYSGPKASKTDLAFAKLIATTTTGYKARYLGTGKPVAFSNSWTHSPENKTKLMDLIEEYSGSVKIRDDWNKVKETIMYDILLLKFMTVTDARTVLLSTGDIKLVETMPVGDNVPELDMGALLMSVRLSFVEGQE